MRALRIEWQLFLLAVQFLTRLPVPGTVPWSDDLTIRSVKFYPLVGGLVGLIGAVVLWIAALILPLSVAVLLSLAATLLATGAFHEDGLADAADGLGGGATRDRALEIMRDSRLGSYGAVTLGTVLALKVAVLMEMPPMAAGMALIAGHGMSRMAAVHIIATTRYARLTGSKFAAPKVTRDGYRWALTTALVLLMPAVLTMGIGAGALGLCLAIALGQGMRLLCLRKLGGYTGDCLGAVQQLSELGFLIGALIWL